MILHSWNSQLKTQWGRSCDVSILQIAPNDWTGYWRAFWVCRNIDDSSQHQARCSVGQCRQAGRLRLHPMRSVLWCEYFSDCAMRFNKLLDSCRIWFAIDDGSQHQVRCLMRLCRQARRLRLLWCITLRIRDWKWTHFLIDRPHDGGT